MKFLKLDDLIFDTTYDLKFKTLVFSGGEQHICIENAVPNDEVTIEVSLTNSDKVMLMMLATDALRRIGYMKINLFAPYLPYARQDRVCNTGEPLSIKVMCQLINCLGFNKVYTLDNHSDVASALLRHYHEINLPKIIMRLTSENSVPKGADFKRFALVSPDAGALKKTYKLSKAMGGIPVIECSKIRDVTTGAITKTVVHSNMIYIKSFDRMLIVDDICDGGKTFIELAKELKRQRAKKIQLFVSHGIFSKGMEVFKGLIDEVITTKSFMNSAKVSRHAFNIEDLI